MRAARQQAPQPQRAQQSMRTTPIAPSVRSMQPRVQVSPEGTGSQEGRDGSVFQGELPHEVEPDLASAKSTLKEANTTLTHTVSVSSESGHAHEETSTTGIMPDCPPTQAASTKQTAQKTQPAAENAFTWNVEAVRSGLVMAEILGPCLALRD
ncbi:MAG: hypothetical protein VB061_10385 [Christensenella sp.]|nr:hypothetical protein [Christensenella sp.]